jgi:hypothetical protein
VLRTNTPRRVPVNSCLSLCRVRPGSILNSDFPHGLLVALLKLAVEGQVLIDRYSLRPRFWGFSRQS